jgi:hypothetical protein
VQPPALTASGARGGEYEEFRKRTWRMIPFAY